MSCSNPNGVQHRKSPPHRPQSAREREYRGCGTHSYGTHSWQLLPRLLPAHIHRACNSPNQCLRAGQGSRMRPQDTYQPAVVKQQSWQHVLRISLRVLSLIQDTVKTLDREYRLFSDMLHSHGCQAQAGTIASLLKPACKDYCSCSHYTCFLVEHRQPKVNAR